MATTTVSESTKQMAVAAAKDNKKKQRSKAEVKLDPKTPIPFEPGGMYFAYSGEQYVPFLGRTDTLFNSLYEARVCSVTHSACISTITNYTIGNGVFMSSLKDGQDGGKEWQDFYKYANGKRQSFNTVLRRIIDGFLTGGNQPMEVVCGQVAGKRYMYVYAKNMMDCRLTPPNSNDENEFMLISRHFRREGMAVVDKTKFKKIPIYKPGMANSDKYFLLDGKVKRTIIFLKNEVSGFDYYGLPPSIASLIYQLLEYGAARFNLDNIDNNMVIGGAVFLTGNLSSEEADRIGKDILKKHTGKGKNGRVAVISSEEGVQDVKYVPFTTQKEGSYEKTDDTAESKILHANQWDAVLAGLVDSSALGKGAGYLEEIYNIKYQTVIRPLVNFLIENLINPLCEIADNWLGTNWRNEKFDIRQIDVTAGKSKAATEIEGITSWLDIIKLVSSGIWQYDAAVKFVMHRFNLTEVQAREQLGDITIIKPQPPKNV